MELWVIAVQVPIAHGRLDFVGWEMPEHLFRRHVVVQRVNYVARADDVDHRGLARFERPGKHAVELLGLVDVLRIASEWCVHEVVPNILRKVPAAARLGSEYPETLAVTVLFEPRAQRAVVVDQVHHGKVQTDGRLDITPADSHTAIAHQHDDWLVARRNRGTNSHPYAVADRSRQAGVDHLSARGELDVRTQKGRCGERIEHDRHAFWQLRGDGSRDQAGMNGTCRVLRGSIDGPPFSRDLAVVRHSMQPRFASLGSGTNGGTAIEEVTEEAASIRLEFDGGRQVCRNVAGIAADLDELGTGTPLAEALEVAHAQAQKHDHV